MACHYLLLLRFFRITEIRPINKLLALRSIFISFRQEHNSRCRHVQHVRDKVIWHGFRRCTLTVTAQFVASGWDATLQKTSQCRIVRLLKRWSQSAIKTGLDQGLCRRIITVTPASLITNRFHYALERFKHSLRASLAFSFQ